jgi:hypothetical protein
VRTIEQLTTPMTKHLCSPPVFHLTRNRYPQRKNEKSRNFLKIAFKMPTVLACN